MGRLTTTLRRGTVLLGATALIAVPIAGSVPAFANGSTGDTFTWSTGDQGSDKAAPECKPGQGTSFTFILSGNGAKIDKAGSGSLNGGDAVDGEIMGEVGGSAHYTVTGGYNTVATTFKATGVVWTGETAPFLKLSHSECTGKPTPPPPTKIKVTAVDGTFDDLCGPTFNVSFKEVSTEGVKYVVTRDGNTLTAKAQVTDADKYELTNPEWTQSYTDKLVDCPAPPTEPSASWDVGQCTDSGQRPVTVTATVPKGASLVRVKDAGEVIDFKTVDTTSGPATVTFNLGNLPAGTYTNYSLDYSGKLIEGFKPIEIGALTVGKCEVTPPPPVCDNLPGAIFTTDIDGNKVNGNIYDAKTDVYLQGGPDKQGAHVPDGTYYYRVTDPSGKVQLYLEGPRTVTVKDGEFPSTPLAPFEDTPNPGGEYKVWLSTSPDFQGKCTKTDTFKVKEKVTPPPVTKYTVTWPTTQCVPGLDDGKFNNKVIGEPVVTPAVAASVASSVNGNTLTYITTSNEGYAPTSAADLLKVFVDDGSNCGVTPPPVDTPKVKVSYTKVDCKTSVVTVTFTNTGKVAVSTLLLSDRAPYLEDYSDGVLMPGKSVTLKSEPLALGEKVAFMAAWADAASEDDSFEYVAFTAERPSDCKPPVKDKCPDMDGTQGPNDTCDSDEVAPPPSKDRSDKPAALVLIPAGIMLIALTGAVSMTVIRRRNPAMAHTSRHAAL